jgi:UDP-N-acetylglucosamine--N-acetylmuramyl-(pentapeptide) pyrophosphoryl-undecaprenol N-acetylglucosamine transferase
VQTELASPEVMLEEAEPEAAVMMGAAPEDREPQQAYQPPALRVLIAAGGTGGHIFPALAVAEVLRARSTRASREDAIRFLGTKRGLEARAIEAAGFPVLTVSAAGLKGIGGWRRVENLLVLPRSFFEAGRALAQFRPDVVVGMGGYLAGPVILEAALSAIPTVLIEPNASPGFTNRVLGVAVTAAAVGFESAAEFYGAKAHLTGQPVRKPFFQVAPKVHAPPWTVLIFGGSQGAAAINRCVIESLPRWASHHRPPLFIHQTGERDFESVRDAYAKHGLAAEVFRFIDDMPGAFARADLVLCRAGASTVAELAAAGKAALLIPFPSATDQHQLENARLLERTGAARVVEQTELTPERLVEEIQNLLARPELLTAMERAARGFARPQAAERIADLIVEVTRTHSW